MCDYDGFAITSDGIYHRNSKESYATHVSFKELLESGEIYWKNNYVYADDKLLAYNSSTLFKDDLVILIKKIVEQVEQGGSALDRYSLKAIVATLTKGCNESKSTSLNRLNNETISGIMKALCALFVLEDYIDEENSNYYIATDDEIKNFLNIYCCDEIYLSFMCDYDGFAITSDGIYHRKSEESYATHVSFKELLKLEELYWKDNYIYTDDKLLAYNSGSALFKDKLVNLIGKIIDEQDEQGRYHLYGYGLESALYRYELENTVMNILKERGTIEDDGNVF